MDYDNPTALSNETPQTAPAHHNIVVHPLLIFALKQISYLKVDFFEAKALSTRKLEREWRHTIARARATLLLDRLHDFAGAHLK